MMEESTLRPFFERARRQTMIVGASASGALLIGAWISDQQFFQSYLLGFTLWMGLSLGSLGVLMLHHLVSGAWGHIIQRMVEAGARMIPLMGALFLPIIFGLDGLYPWTRAEVVEASHVLHAKAGYLNVSFFLVRVAVYFGLWIFGAYWLSGMSRRQDETAEYILTRKMKLFSGPGVIVLVLSVTLASVDWLMSLEPAWYSTIFGMLMIVGMVLTTLSFCIIFLRFLADKPPFAGVLTTRHLHHIGNMLFAFTILWAYMSFSQFLIIWSGNLPEDNFWYVKRIGTSWNIIAVLLLVGHFFVPFALLLSRRRKRYVNSLARVAMLVFVMRLVDYYWLIMPAFDAGGFRLHWMDLVAPVAIGGIWLTMFLRQLQSRPLIPLHDPRFTPLGFHVHDME
jgi:hypothetical protein